MADKDTEAAAVAADAIAADAQEQADFGAGFEGDRPAEKPPAKEKPEPAATPRKEAKPEPKYIQITEADWADVRAAAAKTASYDQQLSKAFGTIGNLQRLVGSLQGQTPAGRRIEIPKDAFAAMERDFPELAQQTRAALEAALSGVSGTGGVGVGTAAGGDDATTLKSLLAAEKAKQQLEELEDAHPDWKKIVGAVDVSREAPDANNPFRRWLAGKDVAYQQRINGSESAAVIGRAIRTFQRETAQAPGKPAATPRDTARADRIRGAVQPRGDNAGAAAGKSDDDEFLAGFNSR
ncbi:MAG: hypothetical protein ABSC06_34420 [Rhodopila sp.]|jgi:hypothetical protein